MTKERLYHESDEDYKAMLDIFFDSNVCISKGTNRHPYADIWHEWLEDTTKELQEYYDVNGDDGWEQVDTEVLLGTYRIKPELVYEYQWAYQHKDMDFYKMVITNCINPKAYFTDEDEVRKYCNADKIWKIVETKRERTK